MLKVIYTEYGYYLERLSQSFETWMSNRVLLSTRLGRSLWVQQIQAAVLLPVDLPEREVLAHFDDESTVELYSGDVGYLEISLKGRWLAASSGDEVGVFVTEMGEQAELYVWNLWHATQNLLMVHGE